MAESRVIQVNGQAIGLTGLDEALEALGPAWRERPQAEVGQVLLEKLGPRNYIPTSARPAYLAALAREYRRWQGLPVQEEPRRGLEVKVLGQGCGRCEALVREVMGALQRLGLAAQVEHITDIREIAALGVMGTPALMLNGQVVMSGGAPSARQLEDWLSQAAKGGQEG